MLYLNKKLW